MPDGTPIGRSTEVEGPGTTIGRRGFLEILSLGGAGALLSPTLLALMPATDGDPDGYGDRFSPQEKRLTGIAELSRKVDEYFAAHPREFIIKEGNQVWKNGLDHSRLEETQKPFLGESPFGESSLVCYTGGVVYLGDKFNLGVEDPEYGPVEVYGFHAAVRQKNKNRWALTPFIWATSQGNVQVTKRTKDAGGNTYGKPIIGSYNWVAGGFKTAEALEVSLVNGNEQNFYDYYEEICTIPGVCNHFRILKRAFGVNNLRPDSLLGYINGNVNQYSGLPVYVPILAHGLS